MTSNPNSTIVTVPYPKHAKAVKWAEGELGVAEHPPGSNSGPDVGFYQSHTWLAGTGWPWCVAYLQTAWAQAGQPLPWKTAGAHNLGDLAHSAGWTTTVDKLIPGDLLDWQIGSGHASIFLGYKNGVVRSVDGNVHDEVAYRERSASLVRYAIHVPEKPAVPPVVKVPVFEVVTSESGHSKVVYVSGEEAVRRKLGGLLARFGANGITIRRKKTGQ